LRNRATDIAADQISTVTDPTTWPLALVPEVGAMREAQMLAKASGPIERGLVRFGMGSLREGVKQIPLTVLRYGLSQADQGDYPAGSAVYDLGHDSLSEGAKHAAEGAAEDLWKQILSAMRRRGG
jgi:hypothetical protein